MCIAQSKVWSTPSKHCYCVCSTKITDFYNHNYTYWVVMHLISWKNVQFSINCTLFIAWGPSEIARLLSGQDAYYGNKHPHLGYATLCFHPKAFCFIKEQVSTLWLNILVHSLLGLGCGLIAQVSFYRCWSIWLLFNHDCTHNRHNYTCYHSFACCTCNYSQIAVESMWLPILIVYIVDRKQPIVMGLVCASA